MKKILGLSVAALMVMGLVGGGTWAYFNDFESVTGNTFEAGTLYMTFGSTNVPFSFDEFEPTDGDNVTAEMELASNITITNSGNLDGKLRIKVTELVNTDGTTGNVTTAGTMRYKLSGIGETDNVSDGELGDYLKMALVVDLLNDGIGENDLVASWNGTGMETTTLSSADFSNSAYWTAIDNYENFEFTNIDLNTTVTAKIYVYTWFPTDNTLLSADTDYDDSGDTLYKYRNMHQQNIAQGDTVGFDIEFTLEQDEQANE